MELSLVPRSVYPWTHLLFDLYFLCTFSSLPALSGFIRAQNILAVFMDSLLPGHLELAENATRRVVLKDHALPGFRMSKGTFLRCQSYIHTVSAPAASCAAPAPFTKRDAARFPLLFLHLFLPACFCRTLCRGSWHCRVSLLESRIVAVISPEWQTVA